MTTKSPANLDFQKLVDILIRLVFITVLTVYSFQILQPFLMIVLWGAILAISSEPLFRKISKYLGERRKLSALSTSLLLLVLVLLPSYYLADSLVGGVSLVHEGWREGKLQIPPPTEQVKNFPLVGKKIFEYWSLAYTNIERLLEPLAPQIKEAASWILGAAAGVGMVAIQFVFSIIISGIILAKWDKCAEAMQSLSSRLNAERGRELLHDAAVTIQSVTRGILGVSFIQAVLVGFGLVVAGIPGAGLWALLALILGITQIGVSPILLVAAIYLFSSATTLKASLFLVWALIVAPLDNILKPIMLGRGATVPMLVIFLGSLGGFIRSGLFGLFVGAVILSLAYKLLLRWMEESQKTEST